MVTELGDLIKWLSSQDPDKKVINGFGEPMSWRGDYYQLAFAPEKETTIKDMLDNALSALGNTFVGYKGGEFVMDKNSEVYIANYSETGEPVTTYTFKYWEIQ